jgi:hypothetical protein
MLFIQAAAKCTWRVLTEASGALGVLISLAGTLAESLGLKTGMPNWVWIAIGSALLFITACKIEMELMREREKNRNPQPTIRLEDVVKRIRGKDDIFGPENSESSEVLKVLTLIRENAANGSLIIFGSQEARYVKPEHQGMAISRMAIPKVFWETNAFDYIAFTTNRDGITKPTRKPDDRSDEYEYIWLDIQQVDAIWPKPKKRIEWQNPLRFREG